jgi:hypothetical protein
VAWTTPLTAVANSALTAAQWNASVRDNLLETGPGKATAAGAFLVTTGANAIAARTIGFATVGTSQTTASTGYVNLATAGPSVTLTTGTSALCFISVQCQNSVANAQSKVSIEVTGATSLTAGDGSEWIGDGNPADQPVSYTRIQPYNGTLTPGSNTFTLKYKVGSGTGTFAERDLVVLPTN